MQTDPLKVSELADSDVIENVEASEVTEVLAALVEGYTFYHRQERPAPNCPIVILTLEKEDRPVKTLSCSASNYDKAVEQHAAAVAKRQEFLAKRGGTKGITVSASIGDKTQEMKAERQAEREMTPDEREEKEARRREYLQKQTDRQERYQRHAENAARRSDAAYKASNAAVAGIPMGQPILVGHHSEKRHRNAIKRSHAAMDRSCAEQKKAEYWERRAASVGSSGAIFSDDPDATEKLAEQIERLELRQELMKSINARVRKAKLSKDTPDVAARLREIMDDDEALALVRACNVHYLPLGFPQFELTNNGANIRRLKARLEQLKARQELEPTEETIRGVRIAQNVAENRTQIFFLGKPDDATRQYLKGHGFRWSPSAGAWQRHLSSGAYYHAQKAAEMVTE